MTRIKICGLFRDEDIDFVNEARPDWCGFVVNFPRSHRNLSPERVRKLRARLSPGIVPVGVFVDQPAEDVAALLRDGTLGVAQLHGHEDEGYLARLRALAPGVPLWRAFRVRTPDDLRAALRSSADGIVLDNGYGTGEVFDWSLAAEFPRPYLLAGGLSPENIPAAIAALHPAGLDLSSGVETGRVKDKNKIIAAVQAARKDKT